MSSLVGSKNSSNSLRLVEVCRKAGVPGYLVDDETEVKQEWLENLSRVAVTAGASAPEHLVDRLIDFLTGQGFGKLETVEIKEEDVRFSLPGELTLVAASLTLIQPAIGGSL